MIADQSVRVIQWYWLSWKHKLATIKSFKADISSLSPMSFALMKSKHSKCQPWNSLWWSIYITTLLIILNFLAILSHWCSTSLFRNFPPFYRNVVSLKQESYQPTTNTKCRDTIIFRSSDFKMLPVTLKIWSQGFQLYPPWFGQISISTQIVLC